MGRDTTLNRQLRQRIAGIAARMMAVDGISDYATAKRKAAREVGTTSRRCLPSNDEVQAALISHLQLYQTEEHSARLTHLRNCALEMMRKLHRFNPHLSGAVLDGSAGRYAAIDIHLFTDSEKEFEFFLLNSDIEYRVQERRIQRANSTDTICLYVVHTETADFEISVFSPHDLRNNVRASAPGRPFQHAGPQTLEAMLADESASLEP